MTASIPAHAGLDHRRSDSDPTAPWSPVPQAYSELTPTDHHPVESPLATAPRHYGNGPVIAALLGAGLACAALGLVIVDNINAGPPRTVAVAPGAAAGPAVPVNASAPGVGAHFVAPAGVPIPPAPAAAPIPDPVPVVAAGPAPAGEIDPPPPPPAPADGPAPVDPATADPGSPPPPPSGPVVVVNMPVLPVPPPVVKPLPPPVVKPPPAPVIPLPIVKFSPPPAPAPAVCLPPHHLVSGHCQ